MQYECGLTIKANRKRGAARAAETTRRKKEQKRVESAYYCSVCLTPYQEFTEGVENWIGCSKCDSWFHFTCVSIDPT